MTFRRAAGRPYNFFLARAGENITFYKKTIDVNEREKGYKTKFFTEERVVPNFTGKNNYWQNPHGQQDDTSGLSIRTTNGELKGCVFTFHNVKYEVKDRRETGAENFRGLPIFHYETTKC